MKRLTLSVTLFFLLLAIAWLPLAAQENCQSFAMQLTDSVLTLNVCESLPNATETPTTPATATLAPTLTPTPLATPQPPTATPIVVPPPSGGVSGIWLSSAEIASLPTTGDAWSQLLSAANGANCTPDLSNQDDSCNAKVMAAGLAFARLHDDKYRTLVVAAISKVVSDQSENGGRTLALGRELAAYVIAADLVDLKTFAPTLDGQFRTRIAALRTETLDSKTLVSCHEGRPNNWGTMCGASRAAVSAYLGDKADLLRTATVFRGYLGDRSAYASFAYGELSWQCNASAPVGVNPPGCTKSGQSIGGVLPDDMRRGGSFKWPPAATGYPWEGLQGAVTQAEILHRAGFPAWQWSDRAVCRAVQFLYTIGWQPSGDDMWQIPLVNARCGTTFATSGLGTPGKIAGWTFWSHAASAGAIVEPQAAPAQRGAIMEQRVVIASSRGDLADEVSYLAAFGWTADGRVQESTDDEGNVVYSRVVVR